MDLHASRWAPRCHARVTPSHANGLDQHQRVKYTSPILSDGLERYDLLLRRLKWKASLLLQSYQRTTFPELYAAGGVVPSFLSNHEPWARPDSEAMFKIDFFEFFVLLERVLLYLLNAMGISISPNASGGSGTSISIPSSNKDKASENFIFRTSQRHNPHSHRFHANVLQALEQPINPLHSTLGMGDVMRYLRIAKECRNRWKDAENIDPLASEGNRPKAETIFLNMLGDVSLEEMLHSIIGALDQARLVLDQALASTNPIKSGSNCTTNDATTYTTRYVDEVMMDSESLETPWEAMADTMEWDEF